MGADKRRDGVNAAPVLCYNSTGSGGGRGFYAGMPRPAAEGGGILPCGSVGCRRRRHTERWIMQNIIIVLLAILSVAMIVLIAIYNGLDRMRFFMDRLLKAVEPGLDDWVDACEALRPGCGEAYRSAKKNWERTAILHDLIDTVREDSEEKQDAQEALLDFCHSYNAVAERYNARLAGALGQVASRMGFHPYGELDFYPGVRLPEQE